MSNNIRGGGAVEVKICGITNVADAYCAIECGADALGFNLFPGSKRFIDVKAAAGWIRDLPNNVRKVAVMVSPGWNDAMTAAQSGLFDCLQLHGEETPEFCKRLAGAGISFIKALPMGSQDSVQQPIDYCTGTILLDSRSATGFGGSGRTFPWSLARQFVELHPTLRIFLAGGLTPENVRPAIESVRPAGVDVTTGVEADLGRKDRGLVQAFIAAARGA